MFTARSLLALRICLAATVATALVGCAHVPAPMEVVALGEARATVVVAADAGPWEKRAGEDLVRYIGRMTGVTPALRNAASEGTAIIVGKAALLEAPQLQARLSAVARKDPVARADAIVMHRAGNRVYLAGTNDESHYFAAIQLLHDWGCRWYLPGDIGEVVPERAALTIGELDKAYAPPFEIRRYWISWLGDGTGRPEFLRRNFMTDTVLAGHSHALGRYTKEIAPDGNPFHVPLAEPATAQHVARKIEADYAAGKPISLGIEDGLYVNDSPADRALRIQYDKYMLRPSMTDAMLTLYNNVGRILREKYPLSKATLGGLAYANVTLPPRVVKEVEPNVVMWLAPIDIDPTHSMDDPKSPPRQEYRDMMYAWAALMPGRVAIYDYDQDMLVWRDIPNPSHRTFAADVQHYRRAGVAGISTESRNAIATTFTNLHFRGQLMWNPDADVRAMEREFYPAFYGPAAGPMSRYWGAVNDAWDQSIVTEHEHFVAPAVYRPELVERLRSELAEAQQALAPLRAKTGRSRNEQLYLDRMTLAQGTFDVLDAYMSLVDASANRADYREAVVHAERGLAARDALTRLNPTYTTPKLEKETASWWKGEPRYMRELLALTDGSKGTLVALTPKQWAWKSEAALPPGWVYLGMEGPVPATGHAALATEEATAANGWRMVDTGLYLQAQGVLAADGQSYTGHYWYQTTLDLSSEQAAGSVRIAFPGLFNEGWLYVNGERIAHRPFQEPWWAEDYRFLFDASLAGKLKPGRNVIAWRGYNPHHYGGIFRRPFLYRAAG